MSIEIQERLNGRVNGSSSLVVVESFVLYIRAVITYGINLILSGPNESLFVKWFRRNLRLQLEIKAINPL